MAMITGGNGDDDIRWATRLPRLSVRLPHQLWPLYTDREGPPETLGLARRCTDEEHADICGVARGIWCADIALNQQRLNIPSYKKNCKSLGILDRTGLGYIT